MGADEVFQNGQAFAEIRLDRVFDDIAGRLGHQASHTGQLTDLILTASGTGIQHGEHRVDLRLAVVLLQHASQTVRQFIVDASPFLNALVVAFLLRDHTFTTLLANHVDVLLGSLDELRLLLRDDHVFDTDGETGARRVFVAKIFQKVKNFDESHAADGLIALLDQTAHFLLRDLLVEETHFLGPDFIEDATANRCHDIFVVLRLRRPDRILSEVRVVEIHEIVHLQVTRLESAQQFMVVIEPTQAIRAFANLIIQRRDGGVMLLLRGLEVALAELLRSKRLAGIRQSLI